MRLPVGSGATFAQQFAELPKEKRTNFVAHKIRKGDTPASLAKRYGVSAEEILLVNKLRSAKSLRVGQSVLIPMNPGAGQLTLAEMRESLRNEPSSTALYTVRSGDSLWSIARRFNISVQQLQSWNGLGARASLKPGQKLTVAASGKNTAPATGKTRESVRTAKAAQTRKIVYEVRPGDNIWTISQKFDVETQQICDWNRLSKNTVLRPGQRLTLLVKSDLRG